MHPIIKPLPAAILILALLSAGCTDTGGGSVQNPTPHKTAEPTQEPTPTDTPIESQHLYDINPDKYDPIEIEANKNLFGIEIEGSKLFDNIPGWEIVYNDDVKQIFKRETYTSFDLYRELQPEQARALEDEYGYPESVVMEQADTDGDGALDKVAVRYEGSKGTWTDTFHFDKRADIEDYIIAHISPEIYPSLIVD